MSSGPRTPGPRHLVAGAPSGAPSVHRFGRPGPPKHAAGSHAGSRSSAPAPTPDVELAEVAPVTRVKRSRLAFAMAVTIAALPVLIVDNLPATAEQPEHTVAAEAPSSTAAPTTVTTAAPTTTTTAAPTTTTTAAPTTTTEAPVVVTTAPPPPPTTVAARRGADPNDPATWDRLAQCESGGNWSANTGNGYYGGLQFSEATWRHYGGTGLPHEASKSTQIAIGKRLQADQGWEAWPGCASALGFYG